MFPVLGGAAVRASVEGFRKRKVAAEGGRRSHRRVGTAGGVPAPPRRAARRVCVCVRAYLRCPVGVGVGFRFGTFAR